MVRRNKEPSKWIQSEIRKKGGKRQRQTKGEKKKLAKDEREKHSKTQLCLCSCRVAFVA